MTASGHIDLPPSMTTPQVAAVFDALTEKGAVARFVGGCVRDAIMGHPSDDIDIATDAPPETVMALLKGAGIRAIPTGIDHGTITAVTDGAHFEITTLRRDVETDGRRAVVAYTDDWSEDATRRDFTINALYADRDGTILDPVGGSDDLMARRVRFVGDAETRIEEDALRILRFFRFHARFGEGAPDRAAFEACSSRADLIDTLSVERIWSEFRRILILDGAVDTIASMREARVLAHLFDAPVDLERLEAIAGLEKSAGRAPDTILRLTALADLDAEAATAWARHLRLSREESRRFASLSADRSRMSSSIGESRLSEWLYRDGAGHLADVVLLAKARDSSSDWAPIDRIVADWSPKTFPLSGADAADAGIKEGPAVGDALRAVERWWIDGGFTADRNACLDKLREIAGA